MNSHWKTQYHQCRICHFNYDYITHLEQSENESKYIFRQLKIQNKTHIPERYSWSPTVKEELWWQTIPRQTTIDIYRHYFADFGEILSLFLEYLTHSVLLGYSPNDVMRFIDSANHSASSAQVSLRDKSRDQLLPLRQSYFKNNQDFYCH